MSDRLSELRAILAGVRRRWARRAFLRAWTLGAGTAAAVLLVGLLAVWLVAGEGVPLVIAAVAALSVAVVSVVFALLPLRTPPTDAQLARFVEERAGDLDDVLVTAVAAGQAPQGPLADRLIADAVRAARGVDLDRVISPGTMRQAAIGAVLGTAALVVSTALFAPAAGRAGHVVGAHLFPTRYDIAVTPGSARVVAGEPLTIQARIPGIDGALAPTITVGTGDEARTARLTPGAAPGEFAITLNNVRVSFPYVIAVGGARSADYAITVIRPVRVSRIDVSYDYPRGLGLQAHSEEDGGDIYAPVGTKVRLTIVTDKPVREGRLMMGEGAPVPLAGEGTELTADLAVARDGSYRVALTDVDGLASAGDTEYFIRMLNDRPPDVRILRPAGDKQVSPIEEVAIEARADDDYGVKALELVFQTPAGQRTVVPLGADGQVTASGLHTIFLEDLKVRPGDFVTFHARARDVGRGRREMESRSDIFFLEVKPYEEEFVASDSQAGAMQGQQTGLEELIDGQKDIIAATWKLDARAERARDARSAQDTQAVAQAQRLLKGKTEQAASQVARASADPRRRRAMPPGAAPGGDTPMSRAIDAMGRAAGELDRIRTKEALPYEMDALNQLLKAAAEIRRRQVARQQAQDGGGNGNREAPDLSTLFDQELRKKQETNYETPSSSESRDEKGTAEADPLDGIRELARRQEALSRQQRDLAKNQARMSEDEITRQLERLSREQNQLRQQAEELSRESQPSAAGTRSLREISEQMRNAANDLKRQDAQQASERGDRALQQLRSLEQQLQGARPDERRRALGDLQMEARQLADAERRLGNEAGRTTPGQAGEGARRRLAAEQERLADRARRLGESVKQVGRSVDAEGGERRAVEAAATEMERQRIAERMRQAAEAMRQGTSPGAAEDRPEEMARALDKVAERLGAATGARDSDTERLSEQLARTQEWRDRLNELQRSMDQLAQAGQPREATEQLQEALRLAEDVRRQNPGMPQGGTPEDWSRSVSAPGTESFKQDFATWESLKKNLLAALEQTETKLSDELRIRESRERLNAGRHDEVADTYRELVDRYYQSLAAPRRTPR